MLEDDFSYVLRKALAGHQLSPADAAAQAGIAEHAVLSFLRGTFSAETARRLAPVLGLDPQAFAAHVSHHPRPLAVPQIHRLDLPFSDGQVNAWLVEAGGEKVLFDAGFETRDLIVALEQNGSRLPDRVFITHGHRDHIGGLDHLLRAGIYVHSAGLPGTVAMKPGDAVFCGPLIVRACDLSGHFVPALGFHIEGLQAPALVTGDALFAGSIGGCATPALYQQALRNLRAALAPLPDQTVILPGHGPATTLGEERGGNPFL
jgi:glyoxylase-like metal-dependent hydrolase (beta-lactamase superfamily II)